MATRKQPARVRAPSDKALPRVRRTKVSELEPDVRLQSSVAKTRAGAEVRPSTRRGWFELVIDDFTPLADAAAIHNILADGFLATALIDRLRFVVGGKAWNDTALYEASSRTQCVVRMKNEDVLCTVADAYRALLRAPEELLAALPKLNRDMLDGQLDAL